MHETKKYVKTDLESRLCDILKNQHTSPRVEAELKKAMVEYEEMIADGQTETQATTKICDNYSKSKASFLIRFAKISSIILILVFVIFEYYDVLLNVNLLENRMLFNDCYTYFYIFAKSILINGMIYLFIYSGVTKQIMYFINPIINGLHISLLLVLYWFGNAPLGSFSGSFFLNFIPLLQGISISVILNILRLIIRRVKMKNKLIGLLVVAISINIFTVSSFAAGNSDDSAVQIIGDSSLEGYVLVDMEVETISEDERTITRTYEPLRKPRGNTGSVKKSREHQMKTGTSASGNEYTTMAIIYLTASFTFSDTAVNGIYESWDKSNVAKGITITKLDHYVVDKEGGVFTKPSSTVSLKYEYKGTMTNEYYLRIECTSKGKTSVSH